MSPFSYSVSVWLNLGVKVVRKGLWTRGRDGTGLYLSRMLMNQNADSPHLYNAGKEGLLQSIGTWGFRDLRMLPDLVTQLGCEFRTS